MVRSGDEIIVQEANMPPVKLILAEATNQTPKLKPLVLGLFEGMGTVPDDFNDELPMEFWLGDDA